MLIYSESFQAGGYGHCCGLLSLAVTIYDHVCAVHICGVPLYSYC